MMTSKTSSGVTVEIEPCGREYCGSPIAELNLHFRHPQHGRCLVVANSYGASGASGYGFMGITGPATQGGKYLPSAAVSIPRADYDLAMAEARRLAAEAVATAMAEDAAEDAAEKEAAEAACPPGHVACQQAWSNGDLCAAAYATEDGVEVIDSDLLENHDGWYWLPAAKVEAARVARDEAAAARAASVATEAARIAELTRLARETGVDQVVSRGVEDDEREDSSFSIVTTYVRPDGSLRTHISPCH